MLSIERPCISSSRIERVKLAWDMRAACWPTSAASRGVSPVSMPASRSSNIDRAWRASQSRSMMRFGQSSSGCKLMCVSTIASGAGSRAVSARPILPSTTSTSGKSFSRRSCICSVRRASVLEIPGSVVGMARTSPSCSGGMNSLSKRASGTSVATRAKSAAPIARAR